MQKYITFPSQLYLQLRRLKLWTLTAKLFWYTYEEYKSVAPSGKAESILNQVPWSCQQHKGFSASPMTFATHTGLGTANGVHGQDTGQRGCRQTASLGTSCGSHGLGDRMFLSWTAQEQKTRRDSSPVTCFVLIITEKTNHDLIQEWGSLPLFLCQISGGLQQICSIFQSCSTELLSKWV